MFYCFRYPKFSIRRLGRDARSTPKSNLKLPATTKKTNTWYKNTVMNDNSWDNILCNDDRENIINSGSNRTVKKKTLKSKSTDVSNYENILNTKNSCNSSKNSTDSVQCSTKSVGRRSTSLKKSKYQVTGKEKPNRNSQSKENKFSRKNTGSGNDEKDSDTSRNSTKCSSTRKTDTNRNRSTKLTLQNVCSNKLKKSHNPLHSSTLTLDSSSTYRKKHVLFE